MTDQPSDNDARALRLLRRLVTVLTAVMIVGIVSIVVLLAIRLNAPPAPVFPDDIALPAGTEPLSITRGPDFLAVVTTDGRILVLDPTGGEITKEITLNPLQ